LDSSRTRNLRIFTHIIAGYMLLALLWWGILLAQQNRNLYETRMTLLLEKEAYDPEEELQVTRHYKRQQGMIIGEGTVFGIALLIGIWFLNRGYTREIETMRQKRNFLLAITHELRSPLASIALIFETFQKRQLERENREKLLNHGLKETQRLSALIDNLLLSARLEKSYHPNFRPSDLNAILKKVIESVGEKSSSIQLSSNLTPENMQGSFDEIGLFSAFYNVIENAVKYSPPGSSIKIITRVSGNQYIVEVQDSGPGIRDAEKRKIFDQFYRSGQEDTRNTQGTGIGLFITKKMVDLHHGTIEILDNKPKGSIFRIILPKSAS
jgi:signal transduction histidine kinase